MALVREELFFESRQSLRSWLNVNHERATGIWAVFYKKSAMNTDLDWEAIVEECLCFGWIDSLPGKVDELRTKIYISPRKRTSGWSARNKRVIQELESKGMVEAPGKKVIARAQENGSWTRFDLAEALVIPAPLDQELSDDSEFRAAWDGLSDAKKRQLLQQIYDAKTVATGLNRIVALKAAIIG